MEESAPVWRPRRSSEGATKAMPHRRLFKKTDTWEYGFDSRAHEQPLEAPKKRRALTTVLFAASFFAGAAFTAFAGDQLASINNGGVDSTAGAASSFHA